MTSKEKPLKPRHSWCTACNKTKLLPDIPEPGTEPGYYAEEPVTIQVVEATKPRVMEETLEDRDPNNLNPHVQLLWDDIFGEPEGAVRSPERAWRISRGCFLHSRSWCYTIMSILLAPPLAMCMGCGYACLAFEQIWCATPCLRSLRIYCWSLRSIFQIILGATVVPVIEACGHICRHIRINFRKDAPDDKDILVI